MGFWDEDWFGVWDVELKFSVGGLDHLGFGLGLQALQLLGFRASGGVSFAMMSILIGFT